jgi:hypothetical protein
VTTLADSPAPTTAYDINAALADLQTQLPRITKDLTAKVTPKDKPGYRYNYADLALISRELLPLMGKLGLSFTSRPTMVDGNFVLVYELRHISGDSIAGVYPLPQPGRATPQEVGGAITYARRYCLCAVTGVAPDDDDNDAQAAEKAAQRERRRDERGGSPAPADNEPRITAQQQRDMQSLFQELGINDKAGRLKFAASAAKRDLRSATELKQAEADKVIATLRAAVEKKTANAAESRPDPEKDPEGWVASQEPPADHKGVPAR